MKYLIVIDGRSPIGAIYLHGNNDGTTTDGKIIHPLLDCTQIAIDNPYYIFATRSLKKEVESHQTLYMPHGSVVAIYQYDENEPRPLGFQ